MKFVYSNFLRCTIFLYCFCDVQSTNKLKSLNYDQFSDSDVFLNSFQLITKYGYMSKKYSVVTEDGYSVKLFRIPSSGPPVLLVHGIGDSSDSWLVLGPSDSIAYLLSNLKYDVWLYNARGNKYSKGHKRNLSQKQYWNFSYEEMGSQDLPTVVDFILAETFYSKLTYIGFSQGTTIFFVMCSLKPDYNAKIHNAFLLAPIATINNIKHPFIDLFTKNINAISKFLDDIGIYDIFSDNQLINLYHAHVCRDKASKKILCEIENLINFGLKNISNLNTNKLSAITSHIPAGVSTKTFIHYFQSYTTGQFARFDYGSERNQLVYASIEPPKFDLSLVSAPVSLFVSGADSFSTVHNVDRIVRALPNVVKYVVLNESLDFTHLEFVYGARVRTLINYPIINDLSSS